MTSGRELSARQTASSPFVASLDLIAVRLENVSKQLTCVLVIVDHQDKDLSSSRQMLRLLSGRAAGQLSLEEIFMG